MTSLLSQDILSLGYPAGTKLKGETTLVDIYADVASQKTLDLSIFNAPKRLYTVAYQKIPPFLVQRWWAACGRV